MRDRRYTRQPGNTGEWATDWATENDAVESDDARDMARASDA